jgi:hypothetical protein
MRRLAWLVTLLFGCSPRLGASSSSQPLQPGEDVQITNNDVGHYGGTLVVAQRSEPKTLNPVTAADIASREVISRMMTDLIHINRA